MDSRRLSMQPLMAGQHPLNQQRLIEYRQRQLVYITSRQVPPIKIEGVRNGPSMFICASNV